VIRGPAETTHDDTRGRPGRAVPRPGAPDGGFTLIELLVVMIIIGILAGIAIPVFLNQRGKAVDTDMKGDLRNVAAAMESYYAGSQAYVAPTQAGRVVTIATGETVTVSAGTTIAVTTLATATTVASGWPSANGYCITATNPRGKSAGGVRFNSLSGGLTTADCPT
jgi:prepilin-type N-terminal cleavage/methylation domain-containing protein